MHVIQNPKKVLPLPTLLRLSAAIKVKSHWPQSIEQKRACAAPVANNKLSRKRICIILCTEERY